MLEHFLSQKILDIHELDDEGRASLHIAVIKAMITGNLDLVKLLLSYNANIFLKDASGKTVYDYVIEQDPDELLSATKYVSNEFNKQRSIRLKGVFYWIMKTKGRMNSPLCYLKDYDLYGVLDLL
jgi:ankyrin repeat protein